MKKVSFRMWCERLEAVIREEFGEEVSYDEDLARSYFREGCGPREFFRENLLDRDLGTDIVDQAEALIGE